MANSFPERMSSVTNPVEDQAETKSNRAEERDTLMDTRSFVLVAAAVAAGVLLYVKPAVGVAVIGAITILATLARLIRR
jgi:hypothetical protein